MPFRSFNTLIIRECFHYHAFYFIISGNVFQGSYADDMYKKKKKKKNHYICYDLLWIVTGAFHLVDLQMIKNSQAT